jgi:hypothetical protein
MDRFDACAGQEPSPVWRQVHVDEQLQVVARTTSRSSATHAA